MKIFLFEFEDSFGFDWCQKNGAGDRFC